MSALPQFPNTLNYGGSQNPRTGRFSKKTAPGIQYKSQKRYETMVRLEAAGIGESAAAAMLCISVPRLRHLKKNPEYLIARMKITHGIILDHDASLTQIKAQRKEMLTQMLPPAIRILANELERPAITLAERKHQAAIMQDLLDREGTFAKVSRTEIKPVDSFDFERYDEQSRYIISAIRGVGAADPPPRSTLRSIPDTTTIEGAEDEGGMHSVEAVEANEAFSNSHTLSQTDQEEALARLEQEAVLLELPIKGVLQ